MFSDRYRMEKNTTPDIKRFELWMQRMNELREQFDEVSWRPSAQSFTVKDSYRLTGVYEIREGDEVIYIGGNPFCSNVRDCLNAHFSGNDGLAIGSYLTSAASNNWSKIFVRWMPAKNPPEVVYYLLQEHRMRHDCYPRFNQVPRQN